MSCTIMVLTERRARAVMVMMLVAGVDRLRSVTVRARLQAPRLKYRHPEKRHDEQPCTETPHVMTIVSEPLTGSASRPEAGGGPGRLSPMPRQEPFGANPRTDAVGLELHVIDTQPVAGTSSSGTSR
jgi:hypothetical protein